MDGVLESSPFDGSSVVVKVGVAWHDFKQYLSFQDLPVRRRFTASVIRGSGRQPAFRGSSNSRFSLALSMSRNVGLRKISDAA